MERLKGQLIMHIIIVAMLAISAIQESVDKQPDASTTPTTTSRVVEMEVAEDVEKELSSTEVQEENAEATEAETVEIAIEQSETEAMSTTEAEPERSTYPEFAYSRDWDSDDVHLLAKIAMAEAEGEDVRTKTLVILTVLNRVRSDDFPDTIEEVIFEECKGVYQFSPVMPGGRWWTTEPNEECYEAVEIVKTMTYDYSEGALYFESCSNEDNWHSRNLECLYESDGMRFYK